MSPFVARQTWLKPLLGLIAALGILAEPSESAEPVTVRVLPRLIEAETMPPSLQVRAVPTDDPSAPVTTPVPRTGGAVLRLDPDRTWMVTIDGEGVWSAPEMVVPAADPEVIVPVHRIGEVQGVLVTEAAIGMDPPPAMTARFQTTGKRFAQAPVAGDVPCRLTKGNNEQQLDFVCSLPSETLDMRLRLQGFVSHFRWSQPIVAGRSENLGTFRMRRGASIVGWVEAEDGSPIDPAQCEVEAMPAVARVGSGPAPQRGLANRLSTNPNQNGFFHLDGLPAGGYTVTAAHDGFSATEVGGIILGANVEATLDDPIVLRLPVTLSVDVRPSRSPDGSAWQVTVMNPERGVDQSLDATAEHFVARDLQAGPAMIIVRDAHGETMAMDEVRLTAGMAPVLVELGLTEVIGEVLLGEVPLRANLTFRDTAGMVTRTFVANEEGHFHGWLPREGDWSVGVTAQEPFVFRRLRRVEVETGAEGVAEVEIRLPDNRLHGQTIDALGVPVPDARVVLVPVTEVEKPVFVRSNEDGHFTFAGLAAGEHQVDAEGWVDGVALTSGTERLNLDESSGRAEVELTLLPKTTVRGMVVNPEGLPIAGAQVTAVSQVSSLPSGAVRPSARSLVDGRFELDLGPGVRSVEVQVMAPGYVFWIGSFPIEPEADLRVPLRRDGGVLSLDFGGGQRFEIGSARPRLYWEERHRLGLITLTQWARSHGEMQGWTKMAGLTLPMMPPGRYRLCIGDGEPEASCRETFLSPGGHAVLKADPPESAHEESPEQSTPRSR